MNWSCQQWISFFQKQFFGAYIAGRKFCPKTNEKETKNNTKCCVEFSYDGGYIFKEGAVPLSWSRRKNVAEKREP